MLTRKTKRIFCESYFVKKKVGKFAYEEQMKLNHERLAEIERTLPFLNSKLHATYDIVHIKMYSDKIKKK